MLTPAEELGLGGLTIASRIRKALYRLPEAELSLLMEAIESESRRRHLVYLREGKEDIIRILPCPIPVLPDQRAYIHHVSLTIQNALKRLPELYMQDFTIREMLQLLPEEDEWLWKCWGPSHRENNPLFGRLDALVDLGSPMWKDSLKFVEPNLSGIGGLHLVPTCEGILNDLVIPLIDRLDPGIKIEIGSDVRELLMQDMLDHLESIGRPGRRVCFVEPKYAGSGPDEQEALATYYHDRFGLKIMHADPRELSLQGEEVYYGGDVVDLAYRDYAVADLISLQKDGVDVSPMQALFKQNRIISSIAAELDQKSCWEVLTDPEITQKYFSSDERQVFRRHILWTRLVCDRETLLPDGSYGDLLRYIRLERDRLVLKPNRSYGGEGVLLGHLIDASQWDQAIEKALKDRDRWVVQTMGQIPVHEFPVRGTDGSVHIEPFHVVMGFAASQYGLSILGRASQRQVVNVAQRGGLCAIMTGHPPRVAGAFGG